jgi:hypothetical protein
MHLSSWITDLNWVTPVAVLSGMLVGYALRSLIYYRAWRRAQRALLQIPVGSRHSFRLANPHHANDAVTLAPIEVSCGADTCRLATAAKPMTFVHEGDGKG